MSSKRKKNPLLDLDDFRPTIAILLEQDRRKHRHRVLMMCLIPSLIVLIASFTVTLAVIKINGSVHERESSSVNEMMQVQESAEPKELYTDVDMFDVRYYRWYDEQDLTPILASDDEGVKRLANSILNEFDEVGITPKIRFNLDELILMLRVTEAEVTGDFRDIKMSGGIGEVEGYDCKRAVANVMVNRVKSQFFPDSLEYVILQKNAFQPIDDGRYLTVTITSETACAVRDALSGLCDDNSQGALMFNSVSDSSPYGDLLFKDGVGHRFFTYYSH